MIDFSIDEVKRFSLGVYQYKKELHCIGCGTDIGGWFIDEKHHLPLCTDCRMEYEEYSKKAKD
jgi:hypothetical protein